MQNSENGIPPMETPGQEVKIEFDGKRFLVTVPLAVGKIGVYGAFAMAQELASRVFWGIEKKEAEAREKTNKGFLQKLHIPGMRN